MTVSVGALEKATVLPADRSGIIVEAARPPARTAAQTIRKNPLSQQLRRPGEAPRPTQAMPLPGSGPMPQPGRVSGAMPRPGAQTSRNGPAPAPSGQAPRLATRQTSASHSRPMNGGAERDWDLALARLIPMRRAVSRITIWVDGEEQVLFESEPR
jgi:hypothetical protein